jgi:hypothetical protein
MKLYVLWLKHEYRGHVDRFVDGIFSTKEKAERRGAGAVKNYPSFYCDFEIESFELDR